MGWADILIIAIIGVSTLISLLRGFVREALSLVGWIVAFLVALTFAEPLSPHAGWISDSEIVQVMTTFIVLFVGTLFAAALLNHFIYKLVVTTGLAGTDRLVGMLFGLARGVAVVAGLVLVGMLAGQQDQVWWQESRLLWAVEPVAAWMHGLLPEDIGG